MPASANIRKHDITVIEKEDKPKFTLLLDNCLHA